MAVLVLTAALFWLFGQPGRDWGVSESVFWGGMIRNDLVTFIFRLMFLSALILTSLLSMDVPRLQKIEYYALLITATIGFSLMAAATDLIMVYVALETASISSYLLAGFYSGERRSSEAGMKYFVYGAFTTAVMLYGLSFIYGVTGQTNLYVIGDVFSGQQIEGVQPLLLLAAVLVVVGFAFKTSIVPYHFWLPMFTKARRRPSPASCPRPPRRPALPSSCASFCPARLGRWCAANGGPCSWPCASLPCS